MTRLDPQVKAVLVARLRERRAAGELTSAQVRRAAAEVGVGSASARYGDGLSEAKGRWASGPRIIEPV
jgi:hypothetical protein